MTHRSHLIEERLFECYLAESGGEPIDPPSAEHLADCPSCAARYAELAAFMEHLRGDGIAEADAVFTPERLRAQQQQIVRRLEHVNRPARVISFPSRMVRRGLTSSTSRSASRWAVGAAAAGLFIGVAVGASFQFGTHRAAPATMTMARQSAPKPLGPVATRGTNPAQIASDDAFLSDLEVALERPHTRELIAFDALTPHVREVTTRR